MINCNLIYPILGNPYVKRHNTPTNLEEVNNLILDVEDYFRSQFQFQHKPELTITSTLLYLGWYSRRMFSDDFKHYPNVSNYILYAIVHQDHGFIPFENYKGIIRKKKIENYLKKLISKEKILERTYKYFNICISQEFKPYLSDLVFYVDYPATPATSSFYLSLEKDYPDILEYINYCLENCFYKGYPTFRTWKIEKLLDNIDG